MPNILNFLLRRLGTLAFIKIIKIFLCGPKIYYSTTEKKVFSVVVQMLQQKIKPATILIALWPEKASIWSVN